MDAPATRRRFDALVLPHLDAAYNLARWLCGNTGDAEDVVQEAFLRAFRLFGSFRGDQPRPWLLAIVRNTWFTTCEKRRGAAETDYEEGEMDTALPDWHGAATDPEQWLMREEDVRLVHAALARLPVVFREVIVLRELEELHYRDIARIAQIPVGTVMSRLARGRRMLAATVTALRGEVPVAAAPAERQDLADVPPAHPPEIRNMDCHDAQLLLQACADGEVGAADSVRLERHLEDCDQCVACLRNLQALRAATRHGAHYHRASADLRARIVTALPGDAAIAPDADASPSPPSSEGWRRWFTWSPAINAAMAGVTVFAVGLGLQQHAMRQSPAEGMVDAVVTSHVRGLISNHAIDVASSNMHVVKPWFNGRVDYAPEVRDLASAGFPLLGGRLDYVDGHRVAVLVYRRDGHPIDVFVLPDAQRGPGGSGEAVQQGYQLQRWAAGGMQYWAVSDASATTLRAFVQAWRNAEAVAP